MIRKLSIILLGGMICLLGVTSALAAKYNEAPMLRTKVAAGELPPVEERLPEEPLVVKPVEEIGQYGGVLQAIDINGVDVGGFFNSHFFVLGQDFSKGTHTYYKGIAEKKLVPNLAKGSEFSEDKKTFALYLRKGVKWSDGAPLTADDVLFWWEDLVNNKELTPVIGSVYKPGGELLKVEKVDAYTVRFSASVPSKFFPISLFRAGNPIAPKHYLSQFHIKYNPKANELAKEAGFDYWWNLFPERNDGYRNPDLPTYGPWKTVEFKPERWIGERNPYFWTVDTAGNQLPYIDKAVFGLSTNRELANMQVISGQVDYATVSLPFGDIPLFKENEAKGNYRLHLMDCPMGAMPQIIVNETYKEDPVLGKILRDVRFRKALSLAIDREEANQVAYFGLSYPTQATCFPKSKFFEPEFAEAYAEHNPQKASQFLDEMGLRWDENHEWRLRPDGKALTVVVESIDAGAVRSYGKFVPLLKEYWEKIGVKTIIKTIDSGLWVTRLSASTLQITLWGMDNIDDFSFEMSGTWLVAGQGIGFWCTTWFALPWHSWVLSQGESGEEPPEEIKEAVELWGKMRDSEDEEEIIQLGKEIFRLQAENLWYIGVVGTMKQATVTRSNLRNFPEDAVWALWLTEDFWPFQWFFKK